MTNTTAVKQLSAQTITSENFQAYGQVIFPSKDGKFFDADDAQLVLDDGIPRFYIMQLQGARMQVS